MARVEKREKNPVGEQGATIDTSPAEWRKEAEALEAAFEKDVDGLATDAQRKLGPMPRTQTDLKKFDTILPWVLLVGGPCLVAGLFTRIAALVCALFLGSVILSQPPWIRRIDHDVVQLSNGGIHRPAYAGKFARGPLGRS